MKIGYSLTTSEIVAAEHADYGDCAKFQITCPRCREAVFKGKRTSRTAFETHYFSHYHASSDEARECEMRVERMARKYLETIAIEGHGQTLGQFMAVLREAVVQGQAELGIIPYATLWRDAQRIAARPDFGIFEKPFRKITDRGISDACHTVPGFNARDDLAAAISRLVPFQGRSLFWCRRQASYVLDVLTHIVTPQAERNFRFVAACCYSVMFRSPRSYPIPDRDQHDDVTVKIARALVEGWSPAKLHQLILSVTDKAHGQKPKAIHQSGDDEVSVYQNLMGMAGPPQSKAALLSSAGGAPFMKMAQIPQELVRSAFDLRTRELEDRLAKKREELYGAAEEIAVITLCVGIYAPFYGLLAGIPIRSLDGGTAGTVNAS